MKREEFERLKEEEKKHLREMRDLKQKLREAQRLRRIGNALHDIERAGDLEGFDLSLEEVQRKAAEQEARLDLAVDSASPADQIDLPPLDEEALQKARAAEFIQRMKVSMGDSSASEKTGQIQDAPKESEEPKRAERSEEEEAPSDFEKTIGRMTPRGKGK